MVARNFSVQDISYSRLLQIPDDEREYLTIDELKPRQLTNLGIPEQHILSVQQPHQFPSNSLIQQVDTPSGYNQQHQHHHHNHHNRTELQPHLHQQAHNIYYDLNSQQQINGAPVPVNSLYLGNNGDMTPNVPLSVMDTTMTAIDIQKQEPHIITEQLNVQHPTQQHQSEHHHPSEHQQQSQSTISGATSKRKRKNSFNTEASDLEDDTGDEAKSVRTTDDNKKQNHSEIEKRRRDKMNTYITELSSMVPMCHAMSRKLDKLTVLRMAVQHLKSIRGAVHSYTEGHYKPAFLSDQELKMLILQAAEGFLFVVGCDRGRILYVSESVSQILNYSQGDLLGQSWFDILHPKDVAKVKEQLSSSDLSPRERLIDAKTMLPVKTDIPQGVSRLCPGARRSFFCRMKCKLAQVKEETASPESNRRKKNVNNDKKYSVIQCTGYLKSWAPAKIGLEEQETDGDGESCNLSCLVAVGRIPPNIFQPNMQSTTLNNNPNLRTIQFISRHAMDGKFLFVDQRATLILGFLPQELLGSSMYEYYHTEDIPLLAESHKAALKGTEKVTTTIYKFRTKEGGFIRLQSEWKSFRNPWTKELEYLIAKNAVILNDVRTMENNNYRNDGNTVPGNFEFFNQSNGREMQRIINTHVEASKIGRQIAEQVLDYQRRVGDSSADSSPGPDTSRSNEPTMSQQLSSNESSLSTTELTNDQRMISPALPNNVAGTSSILPPRPNGSFHGFSDVRNNSVLSPDHASDSEIMHMMSGSAISEPNGTAATSDGNDEAAMAVIMSLLEADAGLGGPVDFTGLPWPLP